MTYISRGFAKGVTGTVSLPIFFPFSSVFSVFSLFSPFSPCFFRFLLSVSFSEKNGETPIAKPLLRNPEFPVFNLDLSFLFCPFLSFLGLARFFWDFPDLLGDGPGIFPICPFPLSRPIKSTYEEQSRKGPRHNLDLSEKSGKHPGLETPRFSFSQSFSELVRIG